MLDQLGTLGVICSQNFGDIIKVQGAPLEGPMAAAVVAGVAVAAVVVVADAV